MSFEIETETYRVSLLEGKTTEARLAMWAEYETKAAAMAAYEDPTIVPGFLVCLDDADYIEIEGPDIYTNRPLRVSNPVLSWEVAISGSSGEFQ